ncbi:3-coathanger stack domain-containing protein [Jiulongibacter sediminis]|nr:3-coathanger stack domain-containing protein [Jiulongibacter sediminis]
MKRPFLKTTSTLTLCLMFSMAAPGQISNPTLSSAGLTRSVYLTAESSPWLNRVETSVTNHSGETFSTGNSAEAAAKSIDTPCPENLEVQTVTDTVYQAAGYLTSNLNAGVNQSYLAGEAIDLAPGFDSGYNEFFEASIEGCN